MPCSERRRKAGAGGCGAIRQIAGFNKTEEYHGFIYIDEKIAYSKNGFSSMSPYELQTLDKVYNTYDVPDNVRKTFKDLDAAENCVQESLFTGDALSAEARKNLRDTGIALVEYLQDAKK